MKLSITNYKTFRWMLLGLFPLLAVSCKKDEIRSKELMVFLQPDLPGIPTQTQQVDLTHTPVEVRGERNTQVHAYASRELDHAVELTIQPAPDLLASYNALRGQNNAILPAGSYQITSGEKYSIAKGDRVSQPIQIQITAPEMLTNPEGYVLPLAITKAESKDKGVVVSNTHKAVYVRISYTYTNVESTQVVPAGTFAVRTGWSVTVSNITNGNPATNLIDGNNSTVWRSSNTAGAEKWIQVDMGAATTMKGMRMSPSYSSANDNATRLTVLTSNDGTTWNFQGIWNGTTYATGTNANNPDYKGIEFISPVTARYFRLEYNAWPSGNRVGMAELNVVE